MAPLYPDSGDDDLPLNPESLDFTAMMDQLGVKRRRSKSKSEVIINPPSEQQVATYDRLVPMLVAAHHEMSELSKKKQDGVVNALKIRNINRLLEELYKLLEDDPSRYFVELLDEETLPQNSDVVLLLSQWRAALEQYKQRYYRADKTRGTYRWFTVENPGLESDDNDW